MYKIVEPLNAFLSYEYNDSKELSYMLLKSLSPISSKAQSNADDLIRAWADIAREGLEGEFKEADLACWEGHYFQFGRLMYHMLDVLVRRDNYLEARRFSDKQLAFFPFDNMIEPLSMGYTSSEDRIFYRCWFDLIGHPSFQGADVNDIESHVYLYWKYVIGILAVDLGHAVHKRNNNEVQFLHI